VTHYEVLGIASNATAEQVKSAFRNAARIHHPDRGGDPDRFQRVKEAYEILSDPGKRKVYDLNLRYAWARDAFWGTVQNTLLDGAEAVIRGVRDGKDIKDVLAERVRATTEDILKGVVYRVFAEGKDEER